MTVTLLPPLVAAGVITDSLGREWDPLKHPRDRKGKFIHTYRRIRAFLTTDGTEPWATGEVSKINDDGSIRMKIHNVSDPANNGYVGGEVDVTPDKIENINEKATLQLDIFGKPKLKQADTGAYQFEPDTTKMFADGISDSPQESAYIQKSIKTVGDGLKTGKVGMITDRGKMFTAMYAKSISEGPDGEGKKHSDDEYMKLLEDLGAPPDVIDDTPDGLSGLKYLMDQENASHSPGDDNKNTMDWFNYIPPTDPDVLMEARRRDSDVRVQWYKDGSRAIVWPDGTIEQHDKNKGDLLQAAHDAHAQEGTTPDGKANLAKPETAFDKLKKETSGPGMVKLDEDGNVVQPNLDEPFDVIKDEEPTLDDLVDELDQELETYGQSELPIDPEDLRDIANDVEGSNSEYADDFAASLRSIADGLDDDQLDGPEVRKQLVGLSDEIGDEAGDSDDEKLTDISQRIQVEADKLDDEPKADLKGEDPWANPPAPLVPEPEPVVQPKASEPDPAGPFTYGDTTTQGKPDFDEIKAMQDYQQSWHGTINKALRTDATPNGEAQKRIDLLDHLLERSTTDKDLKLYRGMRPDGLMTDEKSYNDFVDSLQTGAIVEDKGFVSTTRNLDEANKVFASTDGGKHEAILFELDLPAGSNGFDITEYNKNNQFYANFAEQEILLPRGQKFKVLGIVDNGDGRKIVKIELTDEEAHAAPTPVGELTKHGDLVLSDKQKQWLNEYIAGSEDLNDTLRGTDESTNFVGDLKENVDTIDSLINESAPFEEDTTLYRGLSGQYTKDDAYQELLDKLKPGAIIEDQAYMSTSGDKEIADGFAIDEDSTGKPLVIFTINAPAGAKAFYFDANPSVANGEDEYLLPRRSKLRLDEVVKNEHGHYEISATLLTGNEDDTATPSASVPTGVQEEPSSGPDGLDTGPGDGDTAEPGLDGQPGGSPEGAVSKKFEVLSPEQQGQSGDGYASKPGDPMTLWGKYGASGVMVRHVDNDGTERFLLVQRGSYLVGKNQGKWQLPGGALNEKESDYQGAARELTEELSPPDDFLGTLTPVGEVNFQHPSGWHYNNLAADVPEQFTPHVDQHETGDAGWFTKEEIANLPLHPALEKNLDGIFGQFPETEKKPQAPEPEKTQDIAEVPPVEASYSDFGSKVGLTPEEQSAMSLYGYSVGYRLINPYLHHDKSVFDTSIMAYRPATPQEGVKAEEAIQGLDSAFEKATPLDHSVLVYRRTGPELFADGDMTGESFTNLAYTSTATKLTSHGYGYESKPVFWEITLPTGTKARQGNAHENEVLLPRDGQFDVTSDTTEDGVRHLRVTYHPADSGVAEHELPMEEEEKEKLGLPTESDPDPEPKPMPDWDNAEPGPGSADFANMKDAGGEYRWHPDGVKIRIGMTVKSQTDGMEGEIVRFEKNHDGVVVKGTDGKKRGRKIKKLDIVGQAESAGNKPATTPESKPEPDGKPAGSTTTTGHVTWTKQDDGTWKSNNDTTVDKNVNPAVWQKIEDGEPVTTSTAPTTDPTVHTEVDDMDPSTWPGWGALNDDQQDELGEFIADHGFTSAPGMPEPVGVIVRKNIELWNNDAISIEALGDDLRFLASKLAAPYDRKRLRMLADKFDGLGWDESDNNQSEEQLTNALKNDYADLGIDQEAMGLGDWLDTINNGYANNYLTKEEMVGAFDSVIQEMEYKANDPDNPAHIDYAHVAEELSKLRNAWDDKPSGKKHGEGLAEWEKDLLGLPNDGPGEDIGPQFHYNSDDQSAILVPDIANEHAESQSKNFINQVWSGSREHGDNIAFGNGEKLVYHNYGPNNQSLVHYDKFGNPVYSFDFDDWDLDDPDSKASDVYKWLKSRDQAQKGDSQFMPPQFTQGVIDNYDLSQPYAQGVLSTYFNGDLQDGDDIGLPGGYLEYNKATNQVYLLSNGNDELLAKWNKDQYGKGYNIDDVTSDISSYLPKTSNDIGASTQTPFDTSKTHKLEDLPSIRKSIPFKNNEILAQFPGMSGYQAQQYRNAGFALNDMTEFDQGSPEWEKAFDKAKANLKNSGPLGQNKLKEVNDWYEDVTGTIIPGNEKYVPGSGEAPVGAVVQLKYSDTSYTKNADGDWESNKGTTVPSGGGVAKHIDKKWNTQQEDSDFGVHATFKLQKYGTNWTKMTDGTWHSSAGDVVGKDDDLWAELEDDATLLDASTPKAPGDPDVGVGHTIENYYGHIYTKDSNGNWVSPTGPTIEMGSDADKNVNEYAKDPSKTPPSAPTQTKSGQYLPDSKGDAIYVGSKVQSSSDGLVGTVLAFEKNGTGIVVMGDDGKKRARKAHKMYNLDPDATPHAVAPTMPNPTKTFGPAPKVYTTDPNSPFFDKPKPEKPEMPAQEQVQYVDDAWWKKVSDLYNERRKSKDPNWVEKPLEQSATYSDYAPVKDGNLATLATLHAKGRISDELFQDAQAQIEKNSKGILEKLDKHNEKLKKWHEDSKEWRKANGLPNIELKGMEGALEWGPGPSHNYSEAKHWLDVHQQAGALGPHGHISPDAKQAVSSQKGSNISYALRPLKEKSLDSHEIDQLANGKTVRGMDKAMLESPPVQEDFLTIRTFDTDAFIDPDIGVSYGYGANLSNVVGSIQHDWGFAETSPGSLAKGASPGYHAGGVTMQLRVPKGTRGVWTVSLGHGMGERGFILDRGIAYYIHSATKKNGNWYIDAELISKDEVNYDEFGQFVNENPFFD